MIDIEILYTLLSNEATSALGSISVKKIIEKSQIPISYHSFLRRIRQKLLPASYLVEGYKIGNTKTFYLSESAIEYLKTNVLKDTEDIFELVEISKDEEDKYANEDFSYDEENNAIIYESKNNYLNGGK